MPRGGERTGFRFAVADHARDQQSGVVEHRSKGVTQRVAELPAFVNRSGTLGRGMTRNPSWEGELREQPAQSRLVLTYIRVHLAVRALEVGAADHRRPAMTGSRHVDHIQVILFDDP